MATIKTVFTIKDNVTAQVKTMTSSITKMKFEADLAGRALSFNPKATLDAASAQKKHTKEMQKAKAEAKELTNSIKGMAAAYLGLETAGQALKAFVSISDTLTQIEARLGGIVGEGQALVEANEQIMISAQRARTSYADMADFITRVGFNAKDAFKDMDELTTFAEIVNKQFVLAGTGSREAAMSMIQLSQALASGVLRGEELNSVFEQAPGILQSIANYMGVPIGQIRKMASEGMLTSEIVKNAVLTSASEVEARFNKMPLTWQQIWNQFTNQVIWGLRPLAQAFREATNTEGFRQFMSALAVAISQITGAMAVVIHYLSEWDYIDEVLKSIAFVAGTVAVSAFVLMAKAGVMACVSITKTAMTMGKKLLLAVGDAVAAFMIAHPAALLLAASILFVGTASVAMGNTVEDTIANLVGGFMGLGAVIITVFKNVFEFVRVIAHNSIEALKDTIITGFTNDVMQSVVGLVSNIAKKLEAVGIDTKGLSRLDSTFAGLKSFRPNFITGNYTTFGDAWNSGSAKGQNFVHDMFGAFRDPSKLFDDMQAQINQGMTLPQNVPAYDGSALGDIDDSSKETADNTKKLVESLKIIGFDLAILKASFMDTAMRKIEQNVKLDINMPVTSTSDVDLDGFVNDFVSKIQTELENTSPTAGQTGVRTYA